MHVLHPCALHVKFSLFLFGKENVNTLPQLECIAPAGILHPSASGYKITTLANLSLLRGHIFQYIPSLGTRARWEIKNQNEDLLIWILIGNWILNLICFLHFFYLRTSSAVKMRFYFLHFLQGKNAQNKTENQQNWNLAKIGPKSDKFTKSKP